jgi:hypothetical protein
MSVPALISSVRRVWGRAAERKSEVGRRGRGRYHDAAEAGWWEKEPARRSGAGAGAAAPFAHSRADGGEYADGEGGSSASPPRHTRSSAAFAATSTYADVQNVGRGVRRVCSAGAAARAAVNEHSAGSAERGKERVAVCCAQNFVRPRI